MHYTNKLLYSRLTGRKCPDHPDHLLEHQLEMLEKLRGGARFVMARPRTGKTRPVVAFMPAGSLVVTKKAAIGGWHSEIEALGRTGDFEVVNYEKLRSKRWDMTKTWTGLVLDESHSIGKYPKPNLCVHELRRLSVSGPRVGLTATPSAESYSQLYHQVRALKWPLWASYKNFYAWFKDYGIQDLIYANGRQVETYKKIKPKAWEEFAAHCCIIDRQIVMPSFVEAVDHVVELEDKRALELCEQLKQDGAIKLCGSWVVADGPLALAQKSQQICSGAVLDDEGEAVHVGTAKLDWLERFRGQRVAVLTNYKFEVQRIRERFGDVTDDYANWRSGWFVGSWQRFARGVDLSSAEALIITSCPWSAEGLEQGRDRILNRARTEPAPVYFPVVRGGIDEQIYRIVAGEKRQFTAKQYSARAGHPEVNN